MSKGLLSEIHQQEPEDIFAGGSKEAAGDKQFHRVQHDGAENKKKKHSPNSTKCGDYRPPEVKNFFLFYQLQKNCRTQVKILFSKEFICSSEGNFTQVKPATFAYQILKGN